MAYPKELSTADFFSSVQEAKQRAAQWTGKSSESSEVKTSPSTQPKTNKK